MMAANDALELALVELSDTLPGELFRLNVTLSEGFLPKQCFAWFRTTGEPEEIVVEIPLEPGFSLSAWLRERECEHRAPPGTVLH